MTPTPLDHHEIARHEDELRDLLARDMARTTTPITLGDHALTAGRRMRTRRRLALAAGATAACGLVAVTVPLLLGGAGTALGTTEVDPAGTATTAVESPTPAVDSGWWTMPATEMLDVVVADLPAGVVVTASGPMRADTEEGGPAEGYIVPRLAGPAGPGQLNVMLYPEPVVATGTDGDISCPGNLARRAVCSELRTADGTLVGRRSSTTFGEVTTLEVVLRRDGGTVYAAAANTLEWKWGRHSPASASAPPLDLDQLETLVRDDAWAARRP